MWRWTSSRTFCGYSGPHRMPRSERASHALDYTAGAGPGPLDDGMPSTTISFGQREPPHARHEYCEGDRASGCLCSWRLACAANTKVQWTLRSVTRILVHMRSRRERLLIAAAALGFSSALGCLGSPGGRENHMTTDTHFAVQKSDAEWRNTLSPEQYKVLREHGTERAFTSSLNNEKRQGTFLCAACGQLLFSSDTKYDSGTGWPSFYKPLEGAVGTTIDRSWLSERTEVHCARCGGHLGHVFPDGPHPTGERYCMNGIAMKFEPK